MKKILLNMISLSIVTVLIFSFGVLSFALGFSDVKTNSWYENSVYYCYNNKLMVGTSYNEFSPDVNMTRAMFVVMLAKIDKVDLSKYSNSVKFSDVPIGKWYSKAVAWAFDKKLTSGSGNGKFSPDSVITREEVAVFYYAYANYIGKASNNKADLSKYSDKSHISKWAVYAISWAVGEKLLSGTSNSTLSPKSFCTRAQMSVITMNFCIKMSIYFDDSMYKAYAAVCSNIISKYGNMKSMKNSFHYTGLCYADLIDFNNDGIEELYVIYSKARDTYYADYTYEIWTYKSSGVKKIESGKPFTTDGDTANVVIDRYNDNYYVVTGGTDSFSDEYYHGFSNGNFGVIKVFKAVWGNPSHFEIDGKTVSEVTWNKIRNEWSNNRVFISISDYDLNVINNIIKITKNRLGI